MFIRWKLRAGIVIGLTLYKRFGVREKQVTALKGHDIEEANIGIVRRRKPVRGSIDARADIRAFRGWYSSRDYGAAKCVHPFGPVQFLHERRRIQELAIDAIENIEKAVSVGLHQQATGFALGVAHIRDIHQYGCFIGVIVEDVVRRELEKAF